MLYRVDNHLAGLFIDVHGQPVLNDRRCRHTDARHAYLGGDVGVNFLPESRVTCVATVGNRNLTAGFGVYFPDSLESTSAMPTAPRRAMSRAGARLIPPAAPVIIAPHPLIVCILTGQWAAVNARFRFGLRRGLRLPVGAGDSKAHFCCNCHKKSGGEMPWEKRTAGPARRGENYKHPRSTNPMRPDVGTQAQFRKKSLSPPIATIRRSRRRWNGTRKIPWGNQDTGCPIEFADVLGAAAKARRVLKLECNHWTPIERGIEIAEAWRSTGLRETARSRRKNSLSRTKG